MEVNKIEGEIDIKQVIAECLATDMDLVSNRHHSPVKNNRRMYIFYLQHIIQRRNSKRCRLLRN